MLDIEKDGSVARLCLARPEVRNALDGALLHAISDALGRIESDPGVRVVVLASRGAAFSAGADLASMKKMATATAEENRADARALGAVFHRIASFPKPVIARVQGPAIGGGVGLVAACDLVVAAEEAFFAFSEVRLGIVPAVISPFCIRRLGPARARRLFLTGERIDARRALEYGLVDRVVSAENLDGAVTEAVEHLLEAAPGALAAAKQLVDTVAGASLTDALEYTADLIARLRAGAEAKEGMTAFLEKRSPGWAPPRRR
jgi:methylglutaconyl-CoA hydratase